MNTFIPVREKNIRICGRSKKMEPLPLYWTASGVEFITNSTVCFVDFTSYYDSMAEWIRVEVDGFEMLRMPISKGMSSVCIFDGLEANAKRVRIYKEVQQMRNDYARIFTLDEIRMDGELLPLPEKSLRIEFVGDSLTSGEGLGAPRSQHSYVPTIFSTRGHYAVELEKMLNAEISLVSQSGWGVYSSWDNDPLRSLPPYYEKICGVLKADEVSPYGAYEDFDFDSLSNDIVVVNLCSNDFYAFDSPAFTNNAGVTYKQLRNPDGSFEEKSAKRVEEAVYNFLVKLRACNKNSFIIWAYGMLGNQMEPVIKGAIESYREATKDEKVAYLLLPETQENQYGANNHPGAESHKASAMVLAEKITQLLENN